MTTSPEARLYVASRDCYATIVEKLLKRGANANMKWEDGTTPLYVASQNGHNVCVRILLGGGADVDSPFLNGYTPSCIAAQNGHHWVIEELCKYKPDLNKITLNGFTPIYVASQNGHLECVKILLTNGAKKHITYSDGYTPLYVACQRGHLNVVKYLVETEALDNKIYYINRTTDRGATPLYSAAQKGFSDIVNFLLNNGADIHKPFQNGYTPLHIAIVEGRVEVIKLLLNYGANPMLLNNDGTNCYDIAKKYKCKLNTDTISPFTANELIKKYNFPIITGEVCHENPAKYLERVTSNYAKVRKGVIIQVYKQIRRSTGESGVITTLLLLPDTKVGLGDAYASSIRDVCTDLDNHMCRASEADVLNNNYKGIDLVWAMSDQDRKFMYRIGETVRPTTPFNDQQCFLINHNSSKDFVYDYCTSGVHFFLRKADAAKYQL